MTKMRKKKRHNEAGAAFLRMLTEEMKTLDIEIDEYTAREGEEKKRKAAEEEEKEGKKARGKEDDKEE